ncbi:MAG TPA: cytochrome c peroxidase [Sphingobacteriaceae bacterium]
MRKALFGIGAVLVCLTIISFRSYTIYFHGEIPIDSLRTIYSLAPSQWPKAHVDPGVDFTELGQLPPSPVDLKNDSVRKVAHLGNVLFFDPRLSGSNQIACVSCHAPDLNYADGKQFSFGHDMASTKRNAPSLENVWFYKRLFWDGRAKSLEDQAIEPISSKLEMHQDFTLLADKLSKIKGYGPLFSAAFGDEHITGDRILAGLATFQRTLVTRRTDFDRFLAGDKNSLTDQELHGLHIFRTKGRCMNCHNGPLFTDNQLHNVGLTYYGRKYEDLGLYNITGKPEDVGKFKTPGLRNVMRTAPWFHNGIFPDMNGIMNLYNSGMPSPARKQEQMNDPLFPKTDPLLKPLGLTLEEREAIVAFLHSITTLPIKVQKPDLPQ